VLPQRGAEAAEPEAQHAEEVAAKPEAPQPEAEALQEWEPEPVAAVRWRPAEPASTRC
jgi:hypothetical protein